MPQSAKQGTPRAVVLGGTGHLGMALARSLQERGYDVTAIGRSARPRPGLADTNIRVTGGDDATPGLLESWIAGADIVVDAASPYPLWLYGDTSGQDPVRAALARTDRILSAVRLQGAALVHISSFATTPGNPTLFGQVQDGIMRGLHRYFDLKTRTENRVLAALECGMSGCVLAPTTCLGPYDGKPLDQAFIPMLLTGRVKGLVRHDLNVIDVRDVAVLAAAMITRGFHRRKQTVVGHNICVTSLAQRVCALGGANPPRATVPSLVGMAGMIWMETAFAMIGRKPPAPSLPMMLVCASYAASPDRVQTSLLPDLRPLDKTLTDAIAWYKHAGYC